jgi:hypothetical protein
MAHLGRPPHQGLRSNVRTKIAVLREVLEQHDKPPNGWAPRSPSSARALVENRVIKY